MPDDHHAHTGPNLTFFGVGCLMFRPVKAVSTFDEWVGYVSKGLNSLAAITNLHLDFASDTELVGPPSAWYPDSGQISFDLTIPVRLQEVLYPGAHLRTNTETFHVDARHQFYGPVVFITCRGSSSLETEPAHSVIVVREFLQKELRKADEPLALTTVGPSPFHVNMILCANPDLKEGPPVTANLVPDKAYNEVYFTYQSDAFESINDALLYVFSELEDEFSLFYHFVRQRNERLHAASRVSEQADALISLHRQRGLRGKLRRVFLTSARARDLVLDVISAESAQRMQQIEGAVELQDLYEAANWNLFRPVLERQLAEDFSPVLRSARDTATVLEGVRSIEFQVVVVAASTLLGATAGAIAALLT